MMQKFVVYDSELGEYVGQDPDETDNYKVVYIASDVDAEIARLKWEHDSIEKMQREYQDKQRSRIAELEKAITDHNASCESACGVGNNEGINCGYRPYLPRRCTHCPRDWLIELMVR